MRKWPVSSLQWPVSSVWHLVLRCEGRNAARATHCQMTCESRNTALSWSNISRRKKTKSLHYRGLACECGVSEVHGKWPGNGFMVERWGLTWELGWRGVHVTVYFVVGGIYKFAVFPCFVSIGRRRTSHEGWFKVPILCGLNSQRILLSPFHKTLSHYFVFLSGPLELFP